MSMAFMGEIIPSSSQLVGLSWLTHHLGLTVPLRELSCISTKRLSSTREVRDKWMVFDSQVQVENTNCGHIEFALKHESIDLLVLKTILKSTPQSEILSYIQQNTRGIYQKKLWFIYEFLLEQSLPLEDLPPGKYDDFLNSKDYFTSNNPIKSKRHKINNNLLGIPEFCPIIKKSDELCSLIELNLKEKASVTIGQVPAALIRRAASFLLLADSKASFEIEGESPPKNRIESWGKVIQQAGKNELSIEELTRLHAILIQDGRFTKIGLREEGVFLGDRDQDNNPLPEFIGASEKNLIELLQNWLKLHNKLMKDGIDPILHATIIAFSFVYIHPLEDGNGRLHRYLLHHILAKHAFYPAGLTFPISSVILNEIETYKDVLVSHSSPLMELIEWEPTAKGNVKVLNDTSDLYRYFDCTKACKFIYHCAHKTVTKILPDEIKYLQAFDKSFDEIQQIIEMPDNLIKSLITFISQNNGNLSKRKKEKFFESLKQSEQDAIEGIIQKNFGK